MTFSLKAFTLLAIGIFCFGEIVQGLPSLLKGRSCKVMRDCGEKLNGGKLSCNLWNKEKGEKCLLVHDEDCKKDDDCTNNLICTMGRCACKFDFWWNEPKSMCVRENEFGNLCHENNQCANGLACAVGDVEDEQTHCLKDINGECGANTDCANNLLCLNGKCTCDVGKDRIVYNTMERTCELTNPEVGVVECKSDADCGSSSLACDNMAEQNPYPLTYTCLSVFGAPCTNTYDCVNNMICNLESNLCSCDEGKFYTGNQMCSQNKQFEESCTNSLQCDDVLECNSLQLPNQEAGICLKPYMYECSADKECVNNLNCTVFGVCGCETGFSYVSALTVCTQTATNGLFGESCKLQADCKNGLICSTLGTYIGVCLYDSGSACSTTNDCANLLTCQFDGKCGCHVTETTTTINDGAQPFIYNATTHSCEFAFRFPNEGKSCSSDINLCYNQQFNALQCDVNNTQSSNLCLRTYFLPCLLDTDCYGNLKCDQQLFRCICDPSEGYLSFQPGDVIETECNDYARFKEECKEYKQCFGDLVCNTVSNENQKAFTCLKPMGASCKSDSECANGLECITETHLCGCNQTTSYYQEAVYDCMPNLEYGAICVDDDQCDGDLACDSNPAGTKTFTCSGVENAECTADQDCANNLQCKMGKCACNKGETYDETDSVCSE